MEVLTIVGRGDSWEACPFEGEIWGVATCLLIEGLSSRHYDRVFAFDREADAEAVRLSLPIARERGIPIVSTLSYGDEKYPLFDIQTYFKTNYLRNTVSYMLALAVYQNRSPVEIFGVDQDGDYVRTKPFVTYWLGVANGRGLDFNIHSTSLMPTKVEMRKGEKSALTQRLEDYQASEARFSYEAYINSGSPHGRYNFEDFRRAEKAFNEGKRTHKEPWL